MNIPIYPPAKAHLALPDLGYPHQHSGDTGSTVNKFLRVVWSHPQPIQCCPVSHCLPQQKNSMWKTWLLMTLKSSEDLLIPSKVPTLRSRRKWTAQLAVGRAEESLKLKGIMDRHQTGQQGLSFWERSMLWHNSTQKDNHELVAR